MSEKYIPTTEEVRAKYAEEPDEYQEYSSYQSHTDEEELTEFDRWLAARDARIRREALELSDEELAVMEAVFDREIERYEGDGLGAMSIALKAVAKRREASDVRA